MKRLILVACILLGFLSTPSAFADTGTYRILDYKVTLTTHSSGEVDIDYYQKWLVTGGGIPWITVGTPNADFSIIREKCKGAIAGIRSANEGGWSGVRLDLDKNYLPNETFEVWFSISQRGLFYATDTDYKLDFTPGWYDRAVTDNLTVEIVCFAALDQVKASPDPMAKEDQKIIWGRKDLQRGEHFTVGISFPKTLVAMTNVGQKTQGDNSGLMALLAILFVVIFTIIIIRRILKWNSEEPRRYSGGVYSHGGAFGGRGRLGGGRGGAGGGHSKSSGGGGGFGGAGFSCACACAGCACACACAGGGGAGCSRKIDHTCPLCFPKRKDLW